MIPLSNGQQTSLGSQSPQFKLSSDEVLVERMELKPKEKQTLVIPSDKPIRVGFKTNLKNDFIADQIQKSIKNNIHGMMPKIRQDGTGQGVGSLISCSSFFNPQDGKISLTVSNALDCSVQLLIYTGGAN